MNITQRDKRNINKSELLGYNMFKHCALPAIYVICILRIVCNYVIMQTAHYRKAAFIYGD